ncbi:MAG: V-type ATPase subunit [Candidatus Anstonellales archaeon]
MTAREIVENVLRRFFGPTIYGYSNAKAGAIKSYLLSKDFMIDAISVDTINGMIELMKKTRYGDYINDEIINKYGLSSGLEICMWNRFASTASRMRKILNKNDAKLLDIFLLKYEFKNAKLVLGKKIMQEKIDISNMPIINIETHKKFWHDIANSNRPFELFFSSNVWKIAENAIEKNKLVHIKESSKNINIESFFRMLDVAYYYAINKIKNTMAYKYEILNIDIANIIRVINAKKEGKEIKAKDIMVEGNIKISALLRAVNDDNEMNKILKVYGLSKNDTIENMNNKALMLMLRKLRALFIKAGFSVDKTMLVLLMLEKEIMLIRKIMLAKNLHIEKNILMQEINSLYGG